MIDKSDNGEETCVSHMGQAVSLLVTIRIRRRNVRFPHKGQAVSLHIVVTAMSQMKTKGNHNNNNEFHSGNFSDKNKTLLK